ncbi:putative quinol monooxygenase [Leeuwenhoekiella sp. A2]|uniref:putative quinol monooxygenase n=1 Tax=Leeuwenhoekiella sp. A2 TaxID=3141460 RepID=UPI003A803E3F
MLVRIVKMEFEKEHIEDFQALFSAVRNKIINFEGCQSVELYQDIVTENRFFTYSHWDNTAALEKYRSSSFFKETWARTKVLFSNKPEAWSVQQSKLLS